MEWKWLEMRVFEARKALKWLKVRLLGEIFEV